MTWKCKVGNGSVPPSVWTIGLPTISSPYWKAKGLSLKCDGPEGAEVQCTLRIVTIIRHLESKNMNDPTETIRRNRIAEINVVPGSREDLENRYGEVWDTNQLSEEFQAIGFMAPLIVVRRKSDGLKGSLEFQHSPRFYFNWQPHRN